MADVIQPGGPVPAPSLIARNVGIALGLLVAGTGVGTALAGPSPTPVADEAIPGTTAPSTASTDPAAPVGGPGTTIPPATTASTTTAAPPPSTTTTAPPSPPPSSATTASPTSDPTDPAPSTGSSFPPPAGSGPPLVEPEDLAALPGAVHHLAVDGDTLVAVLVDGSRHRLGTVRSGTRRADAATERASNEGAGS